MQSKIVLFLLVALVMTGCGFKANPYGSSLQNIEALRANYSGIEKKMKFIEFTSDKYNKGTLMCRAAGPVTLPDGETFESYIKNAFIGEMKMANFYSDEEADVKVKAHLDKVDFDSFGGKWIFSLSFSCDGCEPFTLESKYSFTPSFFGDAACQRVAQAFAPAVQKLTNDILTNAKFYNLLN